MKIIVNKKSVIACMIFFSFLPPALIERMFPSLRIVFDIVCVAILALLVLWHISKWGWKKEGIDIAYWSFLIYAFFINILYSPTHLFQFVSQVAFPMISSYFICEYIMCQNRDSMILHISRYLAVTIWLNAIFMVLFPKGILMSNEGSVEVRANWLWGSKNNFVEYLPVIMVLLLLGETYMVGRKKYYRWGTIIVLVLSVISAGSEGTSIFKGSTTASLMLIGAIILVIFSDVKVVSMITSKLKLGILAIISLVWSYIIIIISVIGTEKIVLANWLDLLGKDLTFSGRNIVWKYILSKYSLKRILGIGTLSEKYMFSRTMYNMWLGVNIQYGILGICLLISIFFMSDSTKGINLKRRNICHIGVFMLLVGGTVDEIRFRVLFLLLLLNYYYSKEGVENSDVNVI